MSRIVPPTSPPPGPNPGNAKSPKRVDTVPINNTNNTSTNNATPNVVAEDLLQLLDSRGSSHVIHVPAFGEKVQGTITRLRILLNDLENKGVSIPQAEVNGTFANNLPRKWLSMNQTQKENNSIKNDSLATLFIKNNYKEAELFDWDEESMSYEDEGFIRLKLLWLSLKMSQLYEKSTLDESPSETVFEITSDSESKCDNQEPLHVLPKLLGAEPIGTSTDVSSSRKALKIPKPFIPCKYYGFNDHHSDEYDYYPGCDICGSIAHETTNYDRKISSYNRKLMIANQRSIEPTEKWKKSDAAECIMSFMRKMENLNEIRVKKKRSDNGTEFKNHKLEEFCDEKGIYHNFSSSCTPEQNGVAKRRNKTLIEAARTMLNSSKLPKQLWGEAVMSHPQTGPGWKHVSGGMTS
nr:putative ribonuclease H-like domain-containing protein [Tanacetum cinerariifolium]